MGKGLGSRGLAIAIIGACFTVAPLAGVAFAGEAGGSGDKEVVATLTVDADNVSVKKSGADEFKPAKDGQKLRQGDSVQTDATGKAEIDYSDAGNSYTRLDVNTTFTITKLTEEQGARQVEGSLESGRTWNRTEAITESGTFEQSGGGATAAVTGTAFPVDCTIAAPDCVFTGVEGTFILKGNGEERTVTPFQQCGSTAGDLCDATRTLTVDEMAAILWVQENLRDDLAERGLGTGPIIPDFVIVVENGVVIDVIQDVSSQVEEEEEEATTTTTSSTTTSTSTTTTTVQPPAFGDDPIHIEQQSPTPVLGEGSEINRPVGCEVADTTTTTAGAGCDVDEIVTEDEVGTGTPVEFTFNVTGADGHVLMIRFTEIPGTNYGRIAWSVDGVTWNVTDIVDEDAVTNGTLYPSGHFFRFEPQQWEPPDGDCHTATTIVSETFESCFGIGTDYPQPVTPNPDGTVQWETSFKVEVVDTTPPTTLVSDEVEVPITIIDDICGEVPNRDACYVVTTTTISA